MADEKEIGEVPTTRLARESVVEIVAMSWVAVVFTAVIAVVAGGGWTNAMDWAATSGESVLGEIGWGLGIYVPTLLAFYAIIFGGQRLAAQATAWRLRRVLGLVAEAMFASFVPALLLMGVACLAEPARAGAFFVIGPVSAVMFFLAVQLGGFVVFETRHQLAAALGNHEWAARRLGALPTWSRKSPWVAILANALAASVLGMVASFSSARPNAVLGLFLLCVLTSVGLVLVGTFTSVLLLTARDRITGVFVRILSIGIYLVVVILAAELLLSGPPVGGAGIGLILIALLTVTSASWPTPGVPAALRPWTLRGAATALARVSLERTRREAQEKITALTPEATDAVSPSLADWLSAGVHAYRSS